MSALFAFARSPREGAARVLREGSLGGALLLVAGATAISIVHTLRFASGVPVEDVVYGPDRLPVIDALLAAFGTELTAVVVYLFQSVWSALLVATAVSPLILWLLGATAVHAAARLYRIRRPLAPMLVLVGYATGLTRSLADAVGAAFGPDGAAAGVGEAAGLVALLWLGILVWHGIRAHYDAGVDRAAAILVVAIVLFYLAPVTLVIAAVVAILVAAVVLGYVPAR